MRRRNKREKRLVGPLNHIHNKNNNNNINNNNNNNKGNLWMGTGHRKERQAGALSPLLISFELCRTSLSATALWLYPCMLWIQSFFFLFLQICTCHLSLCICLSAPVLCLYSSFIHAIWYGLAKTQLSHLETRQDGKAATSGNTTIGDLNFAGPVSLYTLCCGTATPAATTMQNSAAGN